MHSLGHEIRLAARRLLRAPAFTAAVVATLALAVGANAAMFAVVKGVVLDPLAYPDSSRLIMLQFRVAVAPNPTRAMPIGLYFQYAERARTLASISAYRTDERTITGDGEPLRANVLLTTASLSTVLRVPPALGRWFTEEEGQPGAPAVAVLSHGLWTRRYGADPGVVGRTLTLNGIPASIVGVMPASFVFPTEGTVTDLWVADQLGRIQGLGVLTHTAVARLRDGATLADARSEMTRLIGDLPRLYPGNPMAIAFATTVKLRSDALYLKDWTVGSYERTLWLLFAAVALVLLVACANIANLFLVRFESRQREVALRAALGAGRVERLRSFLSEAAVVVAAGSAVGLVVALAATRLLVIYGPETLPRLSEVRLDEVGVLFTLGLAAPIALAFASIPLFSRAPLAAALNESSSRTASTPGRHRARQVMMGGQVAMALMVLIAAGLMIRSVQRLRAVDAGFRPTETLTFRIGLPAAEYPTRAAVVATHKAILERLSAIPGVVRVSAATVLPLSGSNFGNTVAVEGRTVPEGTIPPIVMFHAVAGGYTEAIGTRLLRGRGITTSDVDRGELIVVVDQAMADAYFPGEDPVGRRISSGTNRRLLTIVGVVENTPTSALSEPTPRPKVYMPMSIAGGPDIPVAQMVGPNASELSYVVRSSIGTGAAFARAREAIDAVDAKLAMSRVMTLEDLVDRSMSQTAFTMTLLSVAAAVALLLGVVGVYGVTSYVVALRTREIGVRLALGAVPAGLAGMMARQGGIVALAGVGVGLAGAVAGGRVLDSLLFGVRPNDTGVLVATTVVVLTPALGACWLPARRASKLNPVEALRSE
jgi:putative ABC transport system permease protein